MTKRYSIELRKGAEADNFRSFLWNNDLREACETSEAGDYIHFSLDLTPTQVSVCNSYLDS